MDAQMRICPKCGELYIDTGGGACNECIGALKEIEERIIKYVEGHPNVKVSEVASNTDLSEEIIKRYFTNGTVTYPCAKCGSPILEGKYCKICTDTLRKNLDRSANRRKAEDPEKKVSRMNLVKKDEE